MARKEALEARAATGGRQISASLTKEEAKLLAKHEAAHGGVKAAIVAGLQALDGNSLKAVSKAALLAEIERRLK